MQYMLYFHYYPIHSKYLFVNDDGGICSIQSVCLSMMVNSSSFLKNQIKNNKKKEKNTDAIHVIILQKKEKK